MLQSRFIFGVFMATITVSFNIRGEETQNNVSHTSVIANSPVRPASGDLSEQANRTYKQSDILLNTIDQARQSTGAAGSDEVVLKRQNEIRQLGKEVRNLLANIDKAIIRGNSEIEDILVRDPKFTFPLVDSTDGVHLETEIDKTIANLSREIATVASTGNEAFFRIKTSKSIKQIGYLRKVAEVDGKMLKLFEARNLLAEVYRGKVVYDLSEGGERGSHRRRQLGLQELTHELSWVNSNTSAPEVAGRK